MKKKSFKEHFKNHFRKILSEAAPPPPPPSEPQFFQTPFGIPVPNPRVFPTGRDLITPSWRSPDSDNPWDNIPPSSPFHNFPDEIKDLFPKGPKQYQQFQQDSYYYTQSWTELYELIKQWAQQNGLWGNSNPDANTQTIRLYLMGPDFTQIMNRIFSILNRYNTINQDAFWQQIISRINGYISYGNNGQYSSSPEITFPFNLINNADGHPNTPSYWSKPRYLNGELHIFNPIQFPNGILYIANPYPPGSPQWYQWNGSDYEPIDMPFSAPYGGEYSVSPAIPADRRPVRGGQGGFDSTGNPFSQEYYP